MAQRTDLHAFDLLTPALTDLDFPASRAAIIDSARRHDVGEQVIAALHDIPAIVYEDINQVERALNATPSGAAVQAGHTSASTDGAAGHLEDTERRQGDTPRGGTAGQSGGRQAGEPGG